MFGLINPLPSFGFSSGEGEGGASREETLAPVLDAVTSFRDTGALSSFLPTQSVEAVRCCSGYLSCMSPSFQFERRQRQGTRALF